MNARSTSPQRKHQFQMEEAVCKVSFSLYAARTKKKGVPLGLDKLLDKIFNIQRGLDKGWSGKAVHSDENPPSGLL
ncbi:Hypothetical protein FKW44_018706 [Caligus rogercresseyi]|uniref:Uncharacterized protein n=1 Tax=Caligus rogercresseyi TaxID=217165 RepID=A0A7T8JWZ8_CALRO|nr:Hypothetical protein FKW44_018706 [Caligus rogercresseyi]